MENESKGGVRISYAALGALAVGLTIIGSLWKVGSEIATKSDIESIKSALSPQLQQHEMRIRDLELQNAAHWGASPASIRQNALEEAPVEIKASAGKMVLAQYQSAPDASQRPQPPLPMRNASIPIDFIKAYELQPSRGGFYPLLGQDGRLYSLDDIIAALIQLHMAEMRQQIQRAK